VRGHSLTSKSTVWRHALPHVGSNTGFTNLEYNETVGYSNDHELLLMKSSTLVVCCFTMTAAVAQAQVASSPGTAVPAPTPYQVVGIGPNHRVWQCQTYESLPNGQIASHTHTFTELGSGLNFQAPSTGQWVPCQTTIEAFAGGAIVRHCQHQIIFANNLNTSGAVDVQTEDGNRLRSNILGLMYVDPATGQAVQIAGIQDSEGELIGNNEVLYPNAFEGVDADVLYQNRLDGVEQDVILRTQLPAPESIGMVNSPTIELEVFTEFLSPPAARVADMGTDTELLEPDQAISWGATHLGQGKAFIIGGEDTPVKVIKRYVTIGGRCFLLEKVRLADIQKVLLQLPQQSSNARRLPGLASAHFHFPQGPAIKTSTRPMRLAQGKRPHKGYVLDYTSLGSAYTNYTFLGDMTYYVSSALNLAGTNLYEGGTVIKYGASASITAVAGSQVAFHSAPYHPILFTAIDDNTIGETISGSTGNPSGFYANPALNLSSMGGITLSEFRIAYATRGLSVSGTSLTVYDAQFVHCATPISDVNGTVTLENALFSNNETNFNATSSANSIYLENATFNNAFDLIDGSFGSTGIYITNCVFVNVTNLGGSISAGYNGFYQSPSVGSQAATNTFYPLQTAGAASCYLTNGCTLLTNGTTNVFAGLQSLLMRKTTFPPIIYSNITLSVVTNFGPTVSRDTNAVPQPGYHYDPLDYAFGGVSANTNVSFSAGTAVGWFELPGSGGPGYGIGLYMGTCVMFTGTATSACNFDRYSMVQEGGDGLWQDKGYLGGIVNIDSYSASNIPTLVSFFTHFSKPAADSNHFRDGNSGQPISVQATDCEFLNGCGGYNLLFAFTNCLFDRADVAEYTSSTYPFEIYHNCTFHGGSLTFAQWASSAPYWYTDLSDCAFEGTTFAIDDPFGVNTNYASYNYNAFNQGSNQPPNEGAMTVTVTNFNWQSSWFGNYYLPPGSPLIHQGSSTANLLGLYHFTTQTNQIPETNSVVTIGYHYVATDSHGNPLDSNGNGIPDYLEDPTGRGILGAQISLVMPISGSYYTEPATIPIQATVSDWSSLVTNVNFVQGTLTITGITNSPYSYSWPVVSAGVYTIKGIARDNFGLSVTSSVVSVTVTNLCGD